MGLHPADIISGYTKAYRKTLELIESPDLVIERIEGKDIENKEKLARAILAPMASKQYGYESFLAPLVADACLAVMPKNSFNFQVDNVRVVKILGGNLFESTVIHGMVIPYPTIGSLKRIENAKIAVFTCAIQCADTETKGTVLIENASELMSFNASEEKEIDNQIKVRTGPRTMGGWALVRFRQSGDRLMLIHLFSFLCISLHCHVYL